LENAVNPRGNSKLTPSLIFSATPIG
jgi:hypothetical protein